MSANTIKTWQERCTDGKHNFATFSEARDAEIAELRARNAELETALEASEKSHRDLLAAANRALGGDTLMGEPVVQKRCGGVPDPRCNYLATCGSVCNKCGRVHNPMAFKAPLPAPVASEPVAFIESSPKNRVAPACKRLVWPDAPRFKWNQYTPLYPPSAQAQPPEAQDAWLVVGTLAKSNGITVAVHLKQGDITTMLYARTHVANGKTIGMSDIRAAMQTVSDTNGGA